MDQYVRVTSSWSSWQKALTQEWAPSAVVQPAAPQQFLSPRTGLDTHRTSQAQPSMERSDTGISLEEEGEQLIEGDHYHNKQGMDLVGSCPVLSHVPCSVVHMSTSQLQPLLGAMASLLDSIASHHVFGATGTVGRPRGYITLYTICTMGDDKILDKSQHHRWMQFLQIWRSAGWGCSDVVLLTEELRPLQYSHPQILAQIARVDARMMLGCISRYGNSQGHRRFKLKDSLIGFLNVLQQNFSSPKTVLLCHSNVNARLKEMQVTDSHKC